MSIRTEVANENYSIRNRISDYQFGRILPSNQRGSIACQKSRNKNLSVKRFIIVQLVIILVNVTYAIIEKQWLLTIWNNINENPNKHTHQKICASVISEDRMIKDSFQYFKQNIDLKKK